MIETKSILIVIVSIFFLPTPMGPENFQVFPYPDKGNNYIEPKSCKGLHKKKPPTFGCSIPDTQRLVH